MFMNMTAISDCCFSWIKFDDKLKQAKCVLDRVIGFTLYLCIFFWETDSDITHGSVK